MAIISSFKRFLKFGAGSYIVLAIEYVYLQVVWILALPDLKQRDENQIIIGPYNIMSWFKSPRKSDWRVGSSRNRDWKGIIFNESKHRTIGWPNNQSNGRLKTQHNRFLELRFDGPSKMVKGFFSLAWIRIKVNWKWGGGETGWDCSAVGSV